MRLLKTIQKLTLATLLVLALSACSNKDTNDTNATGQTTGTSQGAGEDGAANTGTGGNAGGTTGVSGTESTGTSTQTNTSNEESNANTETSNIVDVTPPVITLNGEANITLEQNENYIEEGATAQDAVDGNVSVSISGNVDTATVGSYTVTYTAQDSAGNEASVSREVVVESKYKILITRKEGNTAKYGRSAYFTISLSHKPTHPVEIYVESDNPNEGIVPKKESWGWDMKTGRIVIHPKDWKRGEQIVIKGRNKNVINGKQDYHIVTSPAVSDDPHFNGVDAEDVWMRGEYLDLVKPDFKHLFFVPGVESAFRLSYKYSGYDDYNNKPIFTLLKSPSGMEMNGNGIYWTPKESDSGKHYTIEVEAKYRKQHEILQFDINVAMLSKPMKSTIKNGMLIIPSSTTCNFGDDGLKIIPPVGHENMIEDIVIREIHKSGVEISKYKKMDSCMFKIEGIYSVWRDIFSPLTDELFNDGNIDKLRFSIELPMYPGVTNPQLYSSDITNEMLPIISSVFANFINEPYYHKLNYSLFSRESYKRSNIKNKQKNTTINIPLHDGVYFIGHDVNMNDIVPKSKASVLPEFKSKVQLIYLKNHS